MLTPNVELNGKKILITGAAGFIGAALAQKLLQTLQDVTVVGLDDLNDYYDVSLKKYRLGEIEKVSCAGRWQFLQASVADQAKIMELFEKHRFDVVVHLAAQAGVRHSITKPDRYIEANIIGFYNILQACRTYPVAHLVYASSSSVYGAGENVPYSVEDKADKPVSLYAATKRSNELMAYAYSGLYKIPATALRFFTVYGPAGRPDMAYFSFTDKLRRGQKIQIFNHGNCWRDFTYVDDVVEGILRVMERAPAEREEAPHRIYNIGNSSPEKLLEFVEILRQELICGGVLPEDHDLKACVELLPMQAGDMPVTYADTAQLERDTGFRPATPLREGLKKFVQWYQGYYLQEGCG